MPEWTDPLKHSINAQALLNSGFKARAQNSTAGKTWPPKFQPEMSAFLAEGCGWKGILSGHFDLTGEFMPWKPSRWAPHDFDGGSCYLKAGNGQRRNCLMCGHYQGGPMLSPGYCWWCKWIYDPNGDNRGPAGWQCRCDHCVKTAIMQVGEFLKDMSLPDNFPHYLIWTGKTKEELELDLQTLVLLPVLAMILRFPFST